MQISHQKKRTVTVQRQKRTLVYSITLWFAIQRNEKQDGGAANKIAHEGEFKIQKKNRVERQKKISEIVLVVNLDGYLLPRTNG